jgi:hypothetical protein
MSIIDKIKSLFSSGGSTDTHDHAGHDHAGHDHDHDHSHEPVAAEPTADEGESRTD